MRRKYLVYMWTIIWCNIFSIVVIKCALYSLNTASNSFHDFIGDFLKDLGFTPSRADKYLWLRKSDKYDGYDYIATHVDEIIIAAKNPSKYKNKIEQNFQVRDITDSPD